MKVMNFNEMLETRTREVEAVVERYLPAADGYQKTVLDAMNYSVRAGGKRLRPMLMEETYRLFGGSGMGMTWRFLPETVCSSTRWRRRQRRLP